MAGEIRTWWETYSTLFGNLIPAQRCAAWSEVWATKGYTNEDTIAVVLELAKLPAAQRPKFPQEHIDWIENAMRARCFQLAIAGRIEPDRISKLLPDWEVDLEAARAKAAALNAPYETPESNAYRTMKMQIRQLKDRTASVQIGSKVERVALPGMRGVGR